MIAVCQPDPVSSSPSSPPPDLRLEPRPREDARFSAMAFSSPVPALGAR
jgi:hypothetical protein